MEKISIEYYTVKMFYDEGVVGKMENFKNFWEACGTYHNWCDSHTFVVTMERIEVTNTAIKEYAIAFYDPEKDKEDREMVFF